MTEAPPPRPSVVGLTSLVRDLSTETYLYAHEVARRLGLHPSDLSAMGVIARSARAGRAVTAGELSRQVRLSPAAVSALLDRLEGVGHVERRRHATDRRKVVLDVTRIAQEASREMFTPLAVHLRSSLSGYSDAELELAARIVRDMTEATRRARAEGLPKVATPPDKAFIATGPTGRIVSASAALDQRTPSPEDPPAHRQEDVT